MNYLRFLAELMEVPIAIVSLGANRDQTIVIEDPIHAPPDIGFDEVTKG